MVILVVLYIRIKKAIVFAMTPKSYVLLFFILTILLCSINSQYYQGITPPFDITNGLPHNEINDIVKDDEGYIWIGTENGLSRYDGYSFITFDCTTHPNVFEKNKIVNIQKNGALLYLLTESDGLIELEPKTLSFKKINTSSPLSVAFSHDTTALLFDTGTLVLKDSNKLIFKRKFKIDDQSNLIIHQGDIILSLNNKEVYRINPNAPSKMTRISIEDSGQAGNLSLSRKYGVILWNGDVVRVLKNDVFVEHPDFVGKKMISYFYEEPDGNTVTIEKNRIPIVNFKKNTVALNFGGLENIQFKSACRVGEGCFLIASNQGVVQLQQTPALSQRINDFQLLQGDQIIVRRKIIEHENKRYYLGFPFVIEENGDQLQHITNTVLSTIDGLVLKNQLFCTTDGRGLISIDLNNKKINQHTCKGIRSNDSFGSICKMSENTLLLTTGNKIIVYNTELNRCFTYYLKKGVVIHEVVNSPDSPMIYLGTNKGIMRLNYSKELGLTVIKTKNSYVSDVRDIIVLKNEIWMATHQGVVVIDANTFKIKHHYFKEDQISHPMVVGLLKDQKGNIWASTYSGLTVFNRSNGSIRFINKSQGLINTEFNFKSKCLLRDGRMVFGGLNSFEIIDPNAIDQYQYKQSFSISGIETINHDKVKHFSSFQENHTIHFNTGKEAAKIYLTNLDYTFGYGYSFKYSLDSKNWFKTDRKNYILLSNLAYGDYVLKIRMYNPFGQLVKEKSFNIRAEVPFYETTSFMLFIIFLLFLFSALFVLYLIRSIRIKAETKSKIAMDLHDESGTILTRLLLLSRREKFEKEDKEQLQTGLKETLYSFRTYLDSISRQKHTSQDLVDELQEFVSATCTEANLEVSTEVVCETNYVLQSELFRDIKLSVYEIINNSIKHSNATQISMHIIVKNKKLNLLIADNGTCNLSELEILRGNGVRNIKNRVARNKGLLYFYIEEGSQGLTVEINIPVS